MDNARARRRRKLLEQATVALPQHPGAGVTIRRGMHFVNRDGGVLGRVAAILVDVDPPRAVALLLDRLPAHRGYLCVPLELVDGVVEDSVMLSLSSEAFDELPRWHDPAGDNPQRQ